MQRRVVYRAAGLDQPTTIQIDANVRNANMRFSKFPYDITSLSGRLSYDSREALWTFHELHGMHGEGKLFGKGSIVASRYRECLN